MTGRLLNEYFSSVFTKEKTEEMPEPITIFTANESEELHNIEVTSEAVIKAHRCLLSKVKAHGIGGKINGWIEQVAARQRTKSGYKWPSFRVAKGMQWSPPGFCIETNLVPHI